MNKLLYVLAFVVVLGLGYAFAPDDAALHAQPLEGAVSQVTQHPVSFVATIVGGHVRADEDGLVLYALTPDNQPVTIMTGVDTQHPMPWGDVKMGRSYLVVCDLLGNKLASARKVTPTKTVPLPHQTEVLTLDDLPQLRREVGEQRTYLAFVRDREITLLCTLSDPGRVVTGYWHPTRYRTFVVQE